MEVVLFVVYDPEAEPPPRPGWLVTGDAGDFPTLVETDRSLLRAQLNMSAGWFGEHDRWWGDAEAFVGGSPPESDPAGPGWASWGEGAVEVGVHGASQLGARPVYAFANVTGVGAGSVGQDPWRSDTRFELELELEQVYGGLLARARSQGALAALDTLEETTQDVMTRMDLYTMYLPRLARWEAEIAVEDATRGVDPEEVIGELTRFTRAVDRIATSAEAAPAVVAGERQVAFEALRTLQATATWDLQAERAIVLEEVEAIARRLLEGSGSPIRAAVREDLELLLAAAVGARKPLVADLEVSLKGVVDHAFLRALQLLLVAAALAAVGAVLHARFLRR